MTILDIRAESAAITARAKELRTAGMTIAAIAKEIGRSTGFVHNAINPPAIKQEPEKTREPRTPRTPEDARDRCVLFLGYAVSWYRERMMV